MKQTQSLLVMFALGLTLAALPAQAVVPEQTDYIMLPVYAAINSPIDLFFLGLACIDFDQDTVNTSGLFNDRGTYEITMEDGPFTHFTAVINPNGGPFFQGKLNIHGIVDRKGPGSSLAIVGSGKMKSWLFAIPPTRTNVAGIAFKDYWGICSGSPQDPERTPNWVPAN